MSRVRKGALVVLAACTISHFLNHLYTGALSPFLPYIQTELSLGYTQVGIITSAAVLAMTLSHLYVGYLGDKGWRETFITVSIVGSAIAMILASYAQSFIILAIIQAGLGIGASGYHPSVFPALSERFPKRERARAIGTQAAGGLIGMTVIPFLGVTLYVLLGDWRPALLVLGLAGLATSIPVFFMMRFGRKGVVPIQSNDSEAGNECNGLDGWTRNYWLGLVSMGLRGMSFRCTSLLMPVYLVATYTSDPVWAGYLTTIMLAAGLVGEVVAATLSDRINRRVPFLVVSTGVTTPALLLLNYSLSEMSLIIVLVMIGFFFYMGVPPNDAYLTEICPRGHEGLAFGLIFSIGSIPGAISPIIFGFIGDIFPDLSASILFLVVTTALATVVALLMRDVPPERTADASTTCIDTLPVG